MNIETTIQSLTSLGAVVAAILAWAAKLQWSKEFSKAKEATIKAKEEQIRILEKSLEEFKKIKEAQIKSKEDEIKILKSNHQTLINIKDQEMENILAIASPKLQEYMELTKVQLESYNDTLSLRVKELEEAMDDKNKLIKSYKDNELNHLEEIEELEKQKIELNNKLSKTIGEKEELQNTINSVEVISDIDSDETADISLASSESINKTTKYANVIAATAAIAATGLVEPFISPVITPAVLNLAKRLIENKKQEIIESR